MTKCFPIIADLTLLPSLCMKPPAKNITNAEGNTKKV